MSASLIYTGDLGRQMWLKGTRAECLREAKRLEAEQGVRSWQLVCLDRVQGRWALTL